MSARAALREAAGAEHPERRRRSGAAASRVLHDIPGRVRLHVPAWLGASWRELEAPLARLRRLPGVVSVEANPLTGNLLVCYDPAADGAASLLETLLRRTTPRRRSGTARAASASAPRGRRGDDALAGTIAERGVGALRRARIPVRGIDRDPALARRMVERLRRFPDVRASANPLTGRVLVEYDRRRTALPELVAAARALEPLGPAEEPRAESPLDDAAIVQSGARLAAVALGVIVLASGGGASAGGGAGVTRVAVAIGALQGSPSARRGLRALLGRPVADLVLALPGVLVNVLSRRTLGLALAAADALRLFTSARAQRQAWRRYERREARAPLAEPGARINLDDGERTPLAAAVLDGRGGALGPDGLPAGVAPGDRIAAGTRLLGGPFTLALVPPEPFDVPPRCGAAGTSAHARYLGVVEPASVGYSLCVAALARSPARAVLGLLLVNARAALSGGEAADRAATSRVIRGGATVVGTRPERVVRRPDVLLLASPRVLTGGLEVEHVEPLGAGSVAGMDARQLQALASTVAAAAGAPWSAALRAPAAVAARDGAFDGATAVARVAGARYTLGPPRDGEVPRAVSLRYRGASLLVLRRGREATPLGVVVLRQRLAPALPALLESCRRRRVEVAVLSAGDPLAARLVTQRAGVALVEAESAVEALRARQAAGGVVALVSDSADAAPAFAACDLAIGLTDGRSRFPARADILVPDLGALAALVDAGARRDAAVRDAVVLSAAGNLGGAAWGLAARPAAGRAIRIGTLMALAAHLAVWMRLRGGDRPSATLELAADPRPERWGRRSIPAVLAALDATERGLASAHAAARRRTPSTGSDGHALLRAVVAEARSPLITILGVGGAFSLALGAPADALIIGITIAVNVAIGAWQARRTARVAEELRRLAASPARVLRDGRVVPVPADQVAPGDIIVLSPGDRVAADARVIAAEGLEVAEAALTGESLPVRKVATGLSDSHRIVLAGSDVTAGLGRAVAVAVGADTRMGATAAAIATDPEGESPLARRLGELYRAVMPVVIAGGAIVTLAGLLRGQPLAPQVEIGASVALAAFPEGLPVLAALGQASVASRLATRRALVHRPGAVEALGRVDVACVDKTGTLTEGRLALRVVSDFASEVALPRPERATLTEPLRRVLETAALASPHPDAPDAGTHATDAAVTAAAVGAGLITEIRARRAGESRFAPERAYHASVARGRLCAKGAPEVLLARCDAVRVGGADRPLDEAGRRSLLAAAHALAGRGLRTLLVAEGNSARRAQRGPEDPAGLVAIGLVGISDPLRAGVRAAVRRCHEAGVRVVMLTGDHPATARAIAREAGLLEHGSVITGAELAHLEPQALERRLDRAAVIARATPIDKLRIIAGLQRRGHVVAMTGDGVNDAPALRLADVGIAMGRSGTDVARQAADVILADDDFATVVEALVEGRGFWHGTRRALGLLLGGNLGELALIAGTNVVGAAAPLTIRQILATNLITDALPALAVATQAPEERSLSALAREGRAALDAPLRRDILARAVSTAVPSLAAYLLALGTGAAAQARTVAFAAVVATQLAQTVAIGLVDGTLTRSVALAVGASAGALLILLAAPGLRTFFDVALPTTLGWGLIGASGTVAPVLNQLAAGWGTMPTAEGPRRPTRKGSGGPERLHLAE
ncbi:MAG TPA: HAD-IC family P-type ATPase [Gemmatimonadaceae bacterium]|nr:HAD-IC family P-type ATPase [Gemmatimonadaceae bacterium]